MKSIALASVKRQKLQNVTIKPKSNQLVCFFVNYNIMSIEISLDIIMHDLEYKIEIKKSQEKQRAKERRIVYSQTAYMTTLLKVFKNMCQLLWT